MTFLRDIGLRPDKGYLLERIDNDGNYEKNNVKWATPAEQTRNKRTNVMLTFNGQTRCIADQPRLLGFRSYTIYNRLKLGWSVEKALTTPLDLTKVHNDKHRR